MNRTDETFQWFKKLSPKPKDGVKDKPGYEVVGYAYQKGFHRLITAETKTFLTKLDVVIGLDICGQILTLERHIKGFDVPCYHSCTPSQFKKKVSACKKYHGVEGGAVLKIYEKNKVVTKKLLGVATWGAGFFAKAELPVGFSVVNSESFFKDYECAKAVAKGNSYKNQCT